MRLNTKIYINTKSGTSFLYKNINFIVSSINTLLYKLYTMHEVSLKIILTDTLDLYTYTVRSNLKAEITIVFIRTLSTFSLAVRF